MVKQKTVSLVRKREVRRLAQILNKEDFLFCDTETTGLEPYKGSRMFALIIRTVEGLTYYFNFWEYDDTDEDLVCGESEMRELQEFLFSRERPLFIFHNAKFDLHILSRSELYPHRAYCSLIAAKVLKTDLMPNQLGLDALGSEIGYPKDSTVEEYIKKHGCYFHDEYGKRTKNKNFTAVPMDIMVEYAARDVEVTEALYWSQQQELKRRDAATPFGLKKLSECLDMEMELLRCVEKMERVGIHISKPYCFKAIRAAAERDSQFKYKFLEITGEEYTNSPSQLQRVFADEKDNWSYGKITSTGKINPTFAKGALDNLTSPAAEAVREIRKAKTDHDYFSGFIESSCEGSIIHADFNQVGAATGRFSSSKPNMQNLKKPSEDDPEDSLLVRAAIVPRREGWVLHSIDYKQMEYRLMLNYAVKLAVMERGAPTLTRTGHRTGGGIFDLVQSIKEGADVHEAMAGMAGVSRKAAKTVNFAMIYGAGDATLGKQLKMSPAEVQHLKHKIFSTTPEIEKLLGAIRASVMRRGRVTTWTGREVLIADPRDSYKGPNYLIQGGCADVVKKAMIGVTALLENYESKLIQQVHDEFVIEGPEIEGPVVIPKIVEIMTSTYTAEFLPLDVDVEHSRENLADKKPGIAYG